MSWRQARRGCGVSCHHLGACDVLQPIALPTGVAVCRERSRQGGMSIPRQLKPADLCQAFGLDFCYLSLLSLLCERKRGHRGYLLTLGLSHLLQGGQCSL